MSSKTRDTPTWFAVIGAVLKVATVLALKFVYGLSMVKARLSTI